MSEPQVKSRIKVPHTLVLLFGMVVLAYFLTFLLPQGQFERVENAEGRMQVVAGSYQTAASRTNLPWYAPFAAIPKGFESTQDIIFFIFIVGGAFGVFRASGAADAVISTILRNFGDVPWLLIASGMFVFAAGSSFIGMAEEYLPFVPVLLALCVGMRMDAVTAIGILCVGYGTGYGVAAFNPFTVMVAQNVAEIPPTSGMGFRLLISGPFLLLGFHHVWSYARKVQKDPTKSLVHDIPVDPSWIVKTNLTLTTRHILVLIATLAALTVVVVGIVRSHWYLVEMGAVFLVLTVVIGIVAGLNIDKVAADFCHGASELTTTALLIGVARSIQVILDDGMIVDTIINGIAQPLQAAGGYVAAVGMLAVQSVCNFFIPSGSGQAFVTMPLMAPLSDLVGVNRQVAVLAYQMGDGFTNILVPTNAVLVGILAMAKIPYERWLKFIFPFMIKVWILGSITLVVAVAIGYS